MPDEVRRFYPFFLIVNLLPLPTGCLLFHLPVFLLNSVRSLKLLARQLLVTATAFEFSAGLFVERRHLTR